MKNEKVYSLSEIRRILSICLYAVEYYGANDEYAKKMADMILRGETILTDISEAVICLDLALIHHTELLNSFDLGNLSQVKVKNYLNRVKEGLKNSQSTGVAN